ncbi:MAG: right-handed parallel beta-helix repeat-containing protein, partial [Acidobacteriota bacterium]
MHDRMAVRVCGGSLLLLIAACRLPPWLPAPSPDAGSDGAASRCGSNLRPYKAACLPILDDCPGNQVPVPGGGCKKVGVEACDGKAGIKGVDGTCHPVGPQRPCLPGWTTVEGGWCEPIVPASRCPEGKMEVIGKAECQPVGDCGTGTWGKIAVGASTIFVDQQSRAPGDGSLAKPFTTISAALAAAPAGAQIAVAAGTYAESVYITKAVTLEGRCPELVKVTELPGTPYSNVMAIVTGGTRIRGLTVSAPRVGIDVFKGASGVVLEQVVLSGCTSAGVRVRGLSEVTLRQSLVSKCKGSGVLVVEGSTLTLERSTVRHSQPLADKTEGFGIGAFTWDEGAPASSASVSDSVVLGNWYRGIASVSASVVVERTLVADTHKDALDDRWSAGIAAGGNRSALKVRDTVLAGNRTSGLDLSTPETATLERIVVRDTLPKGAGPNKGNAIGIALARNQGIGVLRDSLVIGSRGTGVWMGGATALIERSRISNVLLNAETNFGNGVTVGTFQGSPATLEIESSLVEGCSNIGVALSGEDGLPSQLSVSNSTLAAVGHGFYLYEGSAIVERTVIGEGLFALAADLSLRDAVFDRSHYLGIMLLSSTATVERVQVRDTLATPDGFGQWDGLAVYVGLPDDPYPIRRSRLELRDSLVTGSEGSGLRLNYATVAIERCRISGTRRAAGTLGDGLTARDFEGQPYELRVRDSLIEGSARAGLL